jgi:hypothetical protein
MGYAICGKRVSRFFRQRSVPERLAQVSDPREARERRWSLRQVLETVLGALVRQVPSGHRLDETTRTSPPRRVGELELAPIPEAMLPWGLPQLDLTAVRQRVVGSVRDEVRRKRVIAPAGAMRTLAIDGKRLWSGRRGGCEAGQVPGEVRVHRVLRALLTSARPQLLLDHRTRGAEEKEMGALAAFWVQLLQMYGRLSRFEVVTRDAGSCSRHKATLLEAAGDGYVCGLKANQPELWREAPRLLRPMAASQRPEAQVLDRTHGRWLRRSRWRTQECAGWLDWGHLRQVWLGRTETCARQTTPRAASVGAEVATHD